MKRLTIILLGFLPCLFMNAQTSNFNNNLLNISQIAPHLPEASQLLKMAEVPVSEYTGTPDISIPLYTLKTNTIGVPITLRYSASGIRVNQESGWVGLGWTLSLGGIVRQQVGVLDGDNTYASISDWDSMLDNWQLTYRPNDVRQGHEYGYPMWSCEQASPYTPETMVEEGLHGDGEKDLYVVTLPNGKTFKYVLTLYKESGSPYLPIIAFVGNDPKCKIMHSGSSIKIFDTDGTRYDFGQNSMYDGKIMDYNLNQIITEKNDTVSFSYDSIKINSIPSLSDIYILSGPPGSLESDRQLSLSSSEASILKEVRTKTERIVFTTSAVPNGYKLDGMEIYSLLTGKSIYKYSFGYGTFDSCTMGGNYLDASESPYNKRQFPELTDSILGYRLKLTSLQRLGSSDTKGELYSFAYNEQPLPLKTSFATDFWGYYNGQSNSSSLMGFHHTMIPDSYSLNDLSAKHKLPTGAAIRNCDPLYLLAGTLSSITYPTGGKTVFEFEPNTFYGNLFSVEDMGKYSGTETVSVVNNNNIHYSTPTKQFTVNCNGIGNFHVEVGFPNYSRDIVLGSGGFVKNTKASINKSFFITSTNTKDTDKSFGQSDTISLTPGDYTIGCYLKGAGDQGLSGANASSATIKYPYINPAILDTLKAKGGGIRIKSITERNADGTVARREEYSYELESGKTSGVLLAPLQYVSDKNVCYGYIVNNQGTRIDYNSVRYYSSSIAQYSLEGNGVIGYSRVIKKIYDGTKSLGKEISLFPCIEASSYFGYYHFGANLNGQLLSKRTYNSNGKLILDESNDYKIDGHTYNFCNIKAEDNYVGPTDYCVSYGFTVYNPLKYGTRFLITMYPSEGYHINLVKHMEKLYSNGCHTTEKMYSYNSNFLPIVTTTTNSAGISEKDSVDYFIDRGGSTDIFQIMRNKNYLTPVWRHYLQQGNSNMYVENGYDLQGNHLILTQSRLSKNGPGDLVTYKYDDKTNISEINDNNNEPVTYLWGYNYSEVIACIKGATYANILTKVGNDTIKNICSASTFTDNNITTIREALPDCLITTWKYDPSIGMVEQMDTNGKRTYLSYDDLGRLNLIRDCNGKITNYMEYHYAR